MWGRSRKGAGVLLVAVFLSGCNGSQGGAPEEGELATTTAEAERAVHSLFEATNARDADRVLDHYLPGEDLVHVVCTTIREGYAERERVLRMWHEDRAEGDIEYEIVRTQALGADGAVVAARGRSLEGASLFWTFVLRLGPDGSWRVVHEHQSWPGCQEVRSHPGG